MTDRDKVIDGLKEVSEFPRAKADIAQIGKGREVFDSWFRAVEDARELLRERQDAGDPDRLIEKEDVSCYGGRIVCLETIHGDVLVSIVGFGYRLDGEKQTLKKVLWIGVGFDNRGEEYMDEYGGTWRLWKVHVEAPSAEQMSLEPWEVY